MTLAEREELLLSIDSVCEEVNIDFCSVGMVRAPSQIEHAVSIVAKTARLSASAEGASLHGGMNLAAINAAAEGICYLASNTKEVLETSFLERDFVLALRPHSFLAPIMQKSNPSS